MSRRRFSITGIRSHCANISHFLSLFIPNRCFFLRLEELHGATIKQRLRRDEEAAKKRRKSNEKARSKHTGIATCIHIQGFEMDQFILQQKDSELIHILQKKKCLIQVNNGYTKRYTRT